MTKPLFMIAACLCALAAPAGVEARTAAAPITIEGRCTYDNSLAPLLEQGNHAFTLCSSATIDVADGPAHFRFGRSGLGVVMTYGGDLTGDTLAVSSVVVQDGRVRPATGSCRITREAGAIMGIECLGKAGGTFFVTNFAPSRLNR